METDRVRDDSTKENTKPTQDAEVDLEAELMKRGERMLQWFKFTHLPPGLRRTSRIFTMAALQVVDACPQGPERTVALRKLVEAKDCAVRSQLEEPMEPMPRAGAIR